MEILKFIIIGIGFVPVIAGFSVYRVLRFDMKIALYYLLYNALTELIALPFNLKHINNLWLYNIFSLVESIVYFYLFSHWFGARNKVRVFLSMTLLYFILWIGTKFFLSSIMDYDYIENLFKSIIMTLLFGILIVKIQAEDSLPLYRDYRFWFSAAIIFYSCLYMATMIVHIGKFAVNNEKLVRTSWLVLTATNTVSYLLLTYSFLCFYKKRTSHFSS